MSAARARLEALLAQDMARPVHPWAAEAARRLAARYGGQAAAVVFYGSCLRTGDVAGLMLDFYLLVDDYRQAYGRRLPAWGNRLVPPNVYYFETSIDGQTVRAKYAVLTLRHFHDLAGPACFNAAIWARFAQPVALPCCRDDQARQAVAAALAEAHVTLLGRARPVLGGLDGEGLDIWAAAFGLTYGCEFRAESQGRPGDIVNANRDYYAAIGPAAWAALQDDPRFGTVAPGRARLAWRLRAVQGRLLHLARLAKAAFTFTGGVDYLAWKIQRHSGVAITVKPWHRRFPLLAGLWLFAALRLRRAFR